MSIFSTIGDVFAWLVILYPGCFAIAAILEVPNECFYDNELEECADPSEKNMLCGWEKLPTKNFPIIFHSIKGKDMRESNSPSYFNPEEVVVVKVFALLLCSASAAVYFLFEICQTNF